MATTGSPRVVSIEPELEVLASELRRPSDDVRETIDARDARDACEVQSVGAAAGAAAGTSGNEPGHSEPLGALSTRAASL